MKELIIKEIMEIEKLQRILTDIAKELDIGSIKDDKVYIALQAKKNTLKKQLKEFNGVFESR